MASLSLDDAVNELPSSGFVEETNDKTLKMPSVSFQFRRHLLNTAFWLYIKYSKKDVFLQVSVSKLTSDLSTMVNNPQLSDVQLQVDSGDVFFTHSFMLYTRCPLLANMVRDSHLDKLSIR